MAEEQRIEGLRELSRKLLELTPKIRAKHLRPAVGRAAAIVRDEAQVLAPYYHGEVSKGHPPPGTLKKAIVMKFEPSRSSSQQVTFVVAVRHGKSRQRVRQSIFHVGIGETVTYDANLDAFYWRFPEFGTSAMAAANGGQGYMRPAFRARQQAALDALVNRLREGLLDAAK